VSAGNAREGLVFETRLRVSGYRASRAMLMGWARDARARGQARACRAHVTSARLTNRALVGAARRLAALSGVAS
jgi:hypothetical protein